MWTLLRFFILVCFFVLGKATTYNDVYPRYILPTQVQPCFQRTDSGSYSDTSSNMNMQNNNGARSISATTNSDAESYGGGRSSAGGSAGVQMGGINVGANGVAQAVSQDGGFAKSHDTSSAVYKDDGKGDISLDTNNKANAISSGPASASGCGNTNVQATGSNGVKINSANSAGANTGANYGLKPDDDRPSYAKFYGYPDPSALQPDALPVLYRYNNRYLPLDGEKLPPEYNLHGPQGGQVNANANAGAVASGCGGTGYGNGNGYGAGADARARADADATAGARGGLGAGANAQARADADATAGARGGLGAGANVQARGYADATANSPGCGGAGANAQARADADATANSPGCGGAGANAQARADADATAGGRGGLGAGANAQARADADATAGAQGSSPPCPHGGNGGGGGVCPTIVGSYCRYNTGGVQKSQQYYLGPKNINLDICDYIGIEYAFLDKDKLLIQPTNGDNDLKLYQEIGGLQKNSLLVIGSYVDSNDFDKYSRLFRCEEATQNFIKETINSLKQWGLKGLELCIIWPGAVQADPSRGNPDDKNAYLNFVKKVYQAFQQAGLLLIVDIPWQKEFIDKGFDLVTMQNYCDAFNMLTYDFSGSWMPTAGETENLKPTGCESDNRSIDTSVQYILRLGVRPCKLLITIATVARTFTIQNAGQNCIGAKVVKGGPSGPELNAEGILNYSEACVAMRNNWAQPNTLTSYVDVSDATEIALYAKNTQLAGICIMAIDADDPNNLCNCVNFPLTRTVHAILHGADKSPVGRDCLCPLSLHKIKPACCNA